MSVKLRKLGEQVVVITGATSGIGLCTAREAARRGARVVLAARNEEELTKLAAEIEAAGGFALAVPTDVTDARAMLRLRDAALDKLGRIDTWVNNAGLSIYGKLHDVDLVEARRLFDVNFWGVVHGSHAAVSALRDRGGAIINIGSVLSDRVLPIQGMYSASKHAVKGYTDALRMEVEMEGLPISVTLIKPSAIDTPYTDHARNHMETAPKNPPPVYAPQVVADAVLFCAEHPRRDVIVGGGGKVFSVLEKIAPRLTDRLMERTMDGMQKSGRPNDGRDNLFMAPLIEGRERASHGGKAFERSAYTQLALHPAWSAAAVVGLVLAIGALAVARMR
ncbi:MAG: short-chain dehydrogenase [Myxococcaceae bacterium]|nr:short-chain dehydrogenase [Myxococcaceae bacterium]